MMMFAGIIFFASILLIALLFGVKMREERTGRVLASAWRAALDAEALHVKALLTAAELDLKKVPPLLSYWTRLSVHLAALEFARAARAASKNAHHVADLVSHKRTYQRGMTQSEFLKKVNERKNAQTSE